MKKKDKGVIKDITVKIMTNEQKAQEIAKSYPMPPSSITVSDAVAMIENGASQMAEWKDDEFKKHNDELIDKACEMYKKDLYAMNHIVRLITADPQNLIEIDESVEKFRKLLKIECYEKKR